MAKKLNKINLDKLPYVYYDTLVIDDNSNQLVFISLIDNAKALKKYKHELNRKNTLLVSEASCYVSTSRNCFNIFSRKMPKSDFSHLVASRKDLCERTNKEGNELLTSYIYVDNDNLFEDKLYDKLYKHTSIPILKEWISYIRTQCSARGYLKELSVYTAKEEKPFRVYRLRISTEQLLEVVQNGIRGNEISINDVHESSDLMKYTEGLDAYLNIFGDTLANKIQESFVPKFIPDEDEYTTEVNNYDDSCFHNGIELYPAQKNAIQACVNNLKKSNVALLIAEMGTGKTAMGAGIAYADFGRKNGLTASVLCPSHLVEKWKREVERLVPNAKGYIIKNIADLKAIESKIKNPGKLENSFLIMSKESAKFSYELRPGAIWSKSKKTFVCPECGQPLKKRERHGTGRHKYDVLVPFTKEDFLEKKQHNLYCSNKVRKLDRKTNKWTEELCGCNLWVPVNKTDENTDWIKLGKAGWVTKDHVETIVEKLSAKEKLSKKESELFARALDAQEALEDGDPNRGLKAPRKYSVAKYIREKYKGFFDYCICDELHLFKGDSQQGEAMANLAEASKKFIGLTGTLLNGYADGLFYILYRICPRLMQKEGYDYTDEFAFMNDFGVIKRTTTTPITNGRYGNAGPSTDKRLPGVSPIVFTKFLLENAVFLSLSDMEGGLPKYEEIPLEIEMDNDLRYSYEQVSQSFRNQCGWQSENGAKVLGSMVQTLSIYPDMPYDIPDLRHPDTDEVLVHVPELDRDVVRNKEQALLELVQRKVEAGEKVLVYCQWTNKTDVQQKLNKLLKANGIKSVVMTSKQSADTREEWIENQLEKGAQVLICNPSLVETGLDLLSFTTIVFYQLGYNLFTLRQASRRSWRLSQEKDIEVYFMYYKNTIQEQAISLMATKLQASMAIEGKFSEEGLRAMSNNEDLLTQIANSVVEGIKDTVETKSFVVERSERVHDTSRERTPYDKLLVKPNKALVLDFMKCKEKLEIPKVRNKTLSSYASDLSKVFNI